MAIQDDSQLEQRTCFTAELQNSEDKTVVVLSGEIDISVVPALQDSLALAVEGAAPNVNIDLSRVTFLDSTGIGRLVEACRAVRDRGRAFSVTRPPGMPRRVLEIEGLLDYLSVPTHMQK